jgi:cob(I)alamin adenosyltransferase
MKIYTGRGDKGETSLFSGEQVDKDSPRVAAYGSLDELNSILGVAQAFCLNQKVRETVGSLQNELFTAGTDLATRNTGKRKINRIQKKNWRQLEARIDLLQESLPPLRDFILPGGISGAALIHLARTVCRRAERLLMTLKKKEADVNPELIVYLNRLSDLLFVLARYENILEGGKEELWQKEA